MNEATSDVASFIVHHLSHEIPWLFAHGRKDPSERLEGRLQESLFKSGNGFPAHARGSGEGCLRQTAVLAKFAQPLADAARRLSRPICQVGTEFRVHDTAKSFPSDHGDAVTPRQ